MITAEQAEKFAHEWVEAWNNHDLEAILSHYEDDFEMSSPQIVLRMGIASGTLKGKDSVRRYWASALEAYPELKFELESQLVGANSVTIFYQGVRGASAEVFIFGASGKVSHAYAHYAA